MLSVIMQSNIILNVVMLSDLMLCVIMLSDIILSVLKLSDLMLCVVMLSTINLSVVMSTIIMPSVVMLRVVILNVVAPTKSGQSCRAIFGALTFSPTTVRRTALSRNDKKSAVCFYHQVAACFPGSFETFIQ
jgi:hypothetical protein